MVITLAASNINPTEATLQGKIIYDNVVIATTGFEHKETIAGNYTPVSVTLSNDSILTYALTGLTPNTNYQYRAFAVYNNDTLYGNVENFSTQTIGITNAATDNTIAIYPNHTKDAINIVLPENTTNASFLLYDIQGRQLLQQEIQKEDKITVAHLSSGIYIYTIIVNGKKQTGKIVKE
jgi:hypothetical protein